MSVFGESIRVALVILLGLGLIALGLKNKSAAIRNQACRFLLVAAWITPVVATSAALLRQIPVATVSPDLVRAAPNWVPRSALPKESYVVRMPREDRFEASFREESLADNYTFAIFMAGFALSIALTIRGLIGLFKVIGPADQLEPYNGITLCRAKDPTLRVPITFGKTIVLPAHSVDWPEERTHASLLHEAAHVRRHDATWQLVTRFYCAFNWYNPAAYLLAHVMRSTAEEAADDAVLAAGMRPSDYARELLAVAQDLGTFRAPSVAMVGRNGLKTRLHAIVASRRDRRRATLATATVTATLVGGLTLATGGITTRMARVSLPEIPGAIVVPATETAILPDGTQLSLESIQRIDLNRVVTWAPDSGPAKPPISKSSGYDINPAEEGQRAYFGFNVRVVSALAEPATSFSFPSPFGGYASTIEPAATQAGVSLSRAFTKQIDGKFSTDLAVGIACGAWTQHPTNVRTVIPQSPHFKTQPGGYVEFVIPKVAKDADWRATAYNEKDQPLPLNEYGPGKEEARDGSWHAFFGVLLKPGERVAKVTLKYRPYRWVIFKDVRLQPNADAIAAGRRPKIRANRSPSRTTYSVIGVEDTP